MPTINSLHAREILDSRGLPTVEVHLGTEDGIFVASVPSGASVGTKEALELRDGDARFNGKGVLKAATYVNGEIRNTLLGKSFDQKTLDNTLITLDGTENKSRLGANAILGVSVAFARAAAAEQKIPLYRYFAKEFGANSVSLPVPSFNIVNGGKHADSGLSIQEFMIVPMEGTRTQRIEQAALVIQTLRQALKKNGYAISLGDEGGFAPTLKANEEALDMLVSSIRESGYDENKIKIAIDVAATSFYENKAYRVSGDSVLTQDEMIEWYQSLIKKYPIFSIEDPFEENDWDSFAKLRAATKDAVLVVGDDLLTTNENRIKESITKQSTSAVIIKPNQVGTITETFAAARLAREHGIKLFASHRSGETTDTFIVDLAVGLGSEYLKAGSLARGERVAKYNRLMEIEGELSQ